MTEASLVKFVRLVGGYRCRACGNRFRHTWRASFSFCEEHDCGLTLCDTCILALADEVRAAKAGEEPQ
jgi:hypothetical protein